MKLLFFILIIITSATVSMACSTTSILPVLNISVLSGKLMTIFAMSLKFIVNAWISLFFKNMPTLFTSSHSRSWGNVDILGNKRMASLANSLLRINRRRANPSQSILSAGDGFKVIGVYASFISTQVVYVVFIRDSSFMKLIGKTVSHLRSFIHAELSVSTMIDGSDPSPTIKANYSFIPEIFYIFRRGFIHCPLFTTRGATCL